MTPNAFAISLVFGAALVGLWLTARFPDRAPRSVRRLAVHVVAANIAASAAPPAAAHAIGVIGGTPALMLIAFPPLVYFFVACAWLLVFLQRLVGQYR